MTPESPTVEVTQRVDAQQVKQLIQQRLPSSTALDPERLASSLDEFERGRFSNAPRLWRKLKDRNYSVASVARKREKALGRMPWTVLTRADIPDEKKEEAKAHQQALSEFYNHVEATSLLDRDQGGGFRLLAQQILDAQGMRFSVHEITWRPPVGDRPFSALFTLWPLECFENETGRLRWRPNAIATTGDEMPRNEWLVSVGDGLMRATAVLVCLQQLGLQDWAMFSEKFGLPFVIGKTSAAQGSPEWIALTEVVKNFISDGGAVMNTDAMVELVQAAGAGGGSSGPQPGLVEFCDRWISALWRGADLSTMSAGQGDGSGASLQGAESNLLESDDAQFVSDILNTRIDPQVIEYLFGEGVTPLAYVQITPPKRIDATKELLVDQFLLNNGVPLSVDDVRERYGRPAPDDDDELLQPPSKPAADPAQQDPNAAPGAADLANESARQYTAAALDDVAEQLSSVLTPVRARLENIAKIEDPQAQARALEIFRTEIPDWLRRTARADAALVRAVEGALGTAMAQGLTKR